MAVPAGGYSTGNQILSNKTSLDAAGFYKFVINENLSADVIVTHGSTTFAINETSLTTGVSETDITLPTLATGTTGPVSGKASAATIADGVYFVKDTSLLDNATGSSNFAAKGAHRLKFTLTLTSLETSSTSDLNFIELMRVKNGKITKYARHTEYSILEETLARRIFCW